MTWLISEHASYHHQPPISGTCARLQTCACVPLCALGSARGRPGRQGQAELGKREAEHSPSGDVPLGETAVGSRLQAHGGCVGVGVSRQLAGGRQAELWKRVGWTLSRVSGYGGPMWKTGLKLGLEAGNVMKRVIWVVVVVAGCRCQFPASAGQQRPLAVTNRRY